VDAKVLSAEAPLTYADYQSRVKPKAEAIKSDKKIVGWRCKICKYEYKGSELPKDFTCPLCGHGAEDFEPIYE
jgi:rubredoxin